MHLRIWTVWQDKAAQCGGWLALQLIGAFDLVRWAIDRQPDRLVECAARAKRLLERTFNGTPWEADLESAQS